MSLQTIALAVVIDPHLPILACGRIAATKRQTTDIGILDTDPLTTVDRNNSHVKFTGMAAGAPTVKHVAVGDLAIDRVNTDVNTIAKAVFKSQTEFLRSLHQWY